MLLFIYLVSFFFTNKSLELNTLFVAFGVINIKYLQMDNNYLTIAVTNIHYLNAALPLFDTLSDSLLKLFRFHYYRICWAFVIHLFNIYSAFRGFC